MPDEAAFFENLCFPHTCKKECESFSFSFKGPKKPRYHHQHCQLCRSCDDISCCPISGEEALFDLLKSNHFRHEPRWLCKCSDHVVRPCSKPIVEVRGKSALVPLPFTERYRELRRKEIRERPRSEVDIILPKYRKREPKCCKYWNQKLRFPYANPENAQMKLKFPQFMWLPANMLFDFFKFRVTGSPCHPPDEFDIRTFAKKTINFCKDFKEKSSGKEEVPKQSTMKTSGQKSPKRKSNKTKSPKSKSSKSKNYKKSKSPKSKSPKSKSPKSNSPKSKSPKSNSPKSKSPKSNSHKSKSPKSSKSKTKLSKTKSDHSSGTLNERAKSSTKLSKNKNNKNFVEKFRFENILSYLPTLKMRVENSNNNNNETPYSMFSST